MQVKLKKRAERFIQENNGIVNWQALADLKRVSIFPQERRAFDSIYTNVLEYLLDRQVLTYSEPQSFFLTSRGWLNPIGSGGKYYFKRDEDALSFAKAFYPNERHILLNQVVKRIL